MAFCINCGQKLSEGAKFCPNCGKAVTSEKSTSQRKTVYEGNLHKCPNCGEVLDSFVTNCPACGHEIRDTQGASSARQLAMKLEQLESKRPPKKGTNIFEQTFGGGTQLQSIDERKIDLIRNFSIPNTKEDVLEFIVLASANIDLKVYGLDSNRYKTLDPARRELSDAWLAKYEQAYQKAQILFGGTQEFANIQSSYEHKMKQIEKKKRESPLFIIGVVGGSLFLLVFIWVLVFLTGSV